MTMVYLLHFERKYQHAQHYLGWTSLLVEERMEQHRTGRGSRLMEVVTLSGIAFVLARTWGGGRAEERRLKNQKNAPARLCPICRAKHV